MRTGKYPFSSEIERKMSQRVQINNKSTTDSLKDDNIIIEIKLDDFYVLNNYNCKLAHLPGIIEIDSLDSFKMLSRRLSRINTGIGGNNEIKFRKDT